MPSILLCYSSEDKSFVRKLSDRLRRFGVRVWLDEAEINIGDSLTEAIGNAIDKSDFMGVVLSGYSINSKWVQRELQLGLQKEFAEEKVVILPILLEKIKIPPFLRDRYHADFSVPEKV